MFSNPSNKKSPSIDKLLAKYLEEKNKKTLWKKVKKRITLRGLSRIFHLPGPSRDRYFSSSIVRHIKADLYTIGIQHMKRFGDGGCGSYSRCYKHTLRLFKIVNSNGKSTLREIKLVKGPLLQTTGKYMNIGPYIAHQDENSLQFYQLQLGLSATLVPVFEKMIGLSYVYPIPHSCFFLERVDREDIHIEKKISIHTTNWILYQIDNGHIHKLETIIENPDSDNPISYMSGNFDEYELLRPFITRNGQIVIDAASSIIQGDILVNNVYIFDISLRKGFLSRSTNIASGSSYCENKIAQLVEQRLGTEITDSYWHQAPLINAVDQATESKLPCSLTSLIASYATSTISFFPVRKAPQHNPEISETLQRINDLNKNLLEEKVDEKLQPKKQELVRVCHFLQNRILFAGEKSYVDIYQEARKKFPTLAHPDESHLLSYRKNLLTILNELPKIKETSVIHSSLSS